jgi:CSLREA domain-containing protein
MQRAVPASIGLTVLLAFAAAGAARAAPTFTVNSTADEADDNPGDGVCHAPGGSCTLRAAVMEANRAPDPGATIVLPAGTYTLTIAPSGADDETTGDLNLTAPGSGNPTITLTGAGASATIIDGNASDPVLEIDAGRIAVVSGITIRNGQASSAEHGGGITNGGTLTLTGSRVTGNVCPGVVNCLGGGIYNGGTATLTGDLLDENQANRGAGIYNVGPLSMSGDTVTYNTAAACCGGGIATYAALQIDTSTISHNVSAKGGGLESYSATIAITRSTLSDNSATESGGAIYALSSSYTLVNSTIADNSAVADGGGILIDASSDISIASSTIAGNQADSGFTGAGSGGGIAVSPGGSVQFKDTILAGNRDTFLLQNVWISDANECAGTLTSNGYSILLNYDTARCTVNGPFQLADPKLGPLQSNGGPTETEALLAGSPAVDAGVPMGCSDYSGHFLTVDQRGYPRPGAPSTNCDIGAYEVPEPGAQVLGLASAGGLVLVGRSRHRKAA